MVTICADTDRVERIAKEFFGLELPTAMEDLKSAFRRQAKLLHTDTSGANTKEQFVAMKEAYEFLVKAPEVFRSGGFSKTLETTDGTSLSELGLGLGPTVNGKDCDTCDHRGYTESYGMTFKNCNNCEYDGYVPRVHSCKPCGGTGKFTQIRTGRVVNCRVCNGSGKFEHRYQRMPCPICDGSKTLYTKKVESYYLRCWQCRGTGETKVWNPVIPKGRLG